MVGVSPTARGVLTTVYVKYTSDESGDQPFAVVWVRKSSEITVGIALPIEYPADALGPAPKGCKYGGLEKFITLRPSDELPMDISQWAMDAHSRVTARK